MVVRSRIGVEFTAADEAQEYYYINIWNLSFVRDQNKNASYVLCPFLAFSLNGLCSICH